MALLLYNENTALTAGTNADALQRLRDGFIVNRFDGASIADDSDTVLGAANGSNGDNLYTLAGERTFATAGMYAIINKTILMSDFLTLNGAGIHIHFFNCEIIYDFASGVAIGPIRTTTGGLNNNTVDVRVTTDSTTTNSVNFYGCTIFANNGTGNFFQASDMFNCDFRTRADGTGSVMTTLGSRFINPGVASPGAGGFRSITLYGIPDIMEGAELYGYQFELTDVAADTVATEGNGTFVITEPNFTEAGNATRYRTQGSTGDAAEQDRARVRAFQVIGPFTPWNNVKADTISFNQASYAIVAQLGGSGTPDAGGVINYYGWAPGFFEDPAQTIGIEGVRVRVGSNVRLAFNNLDNTTSDNFAFAITNTDTTNVNLTTRTVRSINQFVTDATGRVVAGATSSSQIETTGDQTPNAFTTNRWIDWLSLNATNTQIEGGRVTAQNLQGQNAPENVVIAPIQDIRRDAYNQYAATLEARSLTHRIVIDEIRETGVIGNGAGEQPAGQLVRVQPEVRAGANIVGTLYKTENRTGATPNISFPIGGTVSLNDIRDAYRADWYDYQFTLDSGGDDTFNTPLNITLDNALVDGDGTGVDYIATSGSITVRGNAINATTGDLFTDDANINNLNLNGFSFSGQTATIAGTLSNPGETLSGITFGAGATVSFSGDLSIIGWNNITGTFTPEGTGHTISVTATQANDFFGISSSGVVNGVNINIVGVPVFLTAEINTGNFCYRIGTGAVQGPFEIDTLLASSANENVRTQANLIPGVTSIDSDTITVWYLPASTVNGVGGSTQTVIYDFNRIDWVPTTGNLRLTPFQPDASLLLFGAINAAGYNGTTVTPSSVLDAGIAEFTISAGTNTGITHDAAETQGLAVKILQSAIYLDAVCTADLQNNQRVVSPAANNGIALNAAMQLIRLGSAAQRQISNTSGILATQLTGGIPSVVSLTITLAAATVAQIRDNTISEQQVADLINQQSRSLQRATVPGKGILNPPNDVTP